MLKNIHKIHFVGIGGAGMSALAKILVEKGYEVSGSDLHSSEIVENLKKLGAKIFHGQTAENVRGVDAIVVSTAIPYDNPEVIAARDLGIPKLHRSDINAALLNEVKGIAVAGAHGKTTTTSMLGVALDHAGISPTIIIGGEVDYLGSNAKLGKGEYLVSEADESDGSFLKLRPHIAVVTNVENDHMDHYGTMDNIRKAFREFIENVDKETGWAVLCFENENIRNIAAQVDRKYISYAIEQPADYQAANIETNGSGISFDVMHEGKSLGRVALNIPGRHNVLDAMAAVVTGISIGLTVQQMADGLACFHGAKRRFQTKGRANGIWVVDDYAHHPTEIATTLKAARQTKPKRLICAFQPHRYTRTQLLHKDFGKAFKDADLLILTDVYSAGEAPIEGISGETIVAEVRKQTGQDVVYIPQRADIAAYLKSIAQPGDLIMTMGAGDIYLTGEELVRRIEKVVVVMGGTSTEAEVSRRTGTAILKALQSKGYNAEGMELDPPNFAEQIKKSGCSIVFNALHGKFGEDGILQGTLEMLGIPYTGSGVLASAITMDKAASKRIFQAEGISTPRSETFHRYDMKRGLAAQIQKDFSLPVVVKAASQGSSVGVVIVETADSLADALKEAFAYDEEVLVEEFIKGKELTVAVWGDDEEKQAFPIIEITTVSGRYDYESKYTKGASTHIIPARISDALTKKVQELAVKTYTACGCKGVARVDVMLSEDGVPYVIEVNSMPGMTELSLVPDAGRAMGVEFPELCAHILELAGFKA